jgi:hypothetical protein
MKKIALVLAIALIAVQFIRPEKNISSKENTGKSSISSKYSVPENVNKILKVSCYDCHSNNTVYPTYANIQPLGWWINHHIEEGKHELNFDEFATYSIRKQYKKFDKMADEVKDGGMPLKSYTLIHKNAILSIEQKELLTNWAIAIKDSIEANYPADSLKKK